MLGEDRGRGAVGPRMEMRHWVGFMVWLGHLYCGWLHL